MPLFWLKRFRTLWRRIRAGATNVEYVNSNLGNAETEEIGLLIEDLIEDVSIDGMCGVY